MRLGRQPRPGSPEALTGGPVDGDYYGSAAGAGQLLGVTVTTAIRYWESLRQLGGGGGGEITTAIRHWETVGVQST